MNKHSILVVDDNHINRLFFESSLKKLNFQVSTALSGSLAVELCQQNRFDLILMDIRMDDMDGIETATRVRQLPSHSKTPIIAISAERFDCQPHPVFIDSFSKPINQADLKSGILKHLQSVQQDSANKQFFNEKLAAEISHNDTQIISKLRRILVKQLPIDSIQVEQLYQNQKWNELSECLHKLLGSAKICAAELLVEHIEILSISVKQQHYDPRILKRLKTVIDQTIQAAVLSDENI